MKNELNVVVVMSETGQRSFRKFQNEELGVQFFTIAKEHFVNHRVFLATLSTPVKAPPDYRPSKWGRLFCPYCNDERLYKPDELDSLKCVVCGISTNDYFVKNANHLWPSGASKKK